MSRDAHQEDLLDLLAEKATAGLDAEATSRLEQLLAGAREHDDHFELAAAALELAGPTFDEALPPGVELRLRREARRFAAGLPRSNVKAFRPRGVAPAMAAEKAERGDELPAAKVLVGANSNSASRVLLPWLVAAACALAAVTGWWRVFTLTGQADLSPSGPFATTEVPAAKNPAIARASLLESQQRAVPVPWTGTKDPAAQGVTGDVVWSPEKQQGFLRFQNLPGNDPKVFQYQLWIFDGTRDERFPIDGGVFDVPAGGEVVIPITAKLPVREATVFAVTIEKPGGVVVSSRERIVVLAKLI